MPWSPKPKRRHEKSSGPAILARLRADEVMLRHAERHRMSEPLEEMCARFALTHTSADKAFGLLKAHLAYREKHDVLSLSRLTARKVFPSSEAQIAYNRCMPHGILGRDRGGRR